MNRKFDEKYSSFLNESQKKLINNFIKDDHDSIINNYIDLKESCIRLLDNYMLS